MQVEALDGSLERQIDDVVTGLRQCVGYRTVWIDPFGMLWHAEPEDDQLDAMGYRYVGTFCRPDPDALRAELRGFALPEVACISVQRPAAAPSIKPAAVPAFAAAV
jgi:hypothetical protein